MGDINWGMLQPLNQISPIRTAEPQAVSGSAPMIQPGSQMSGAADMMNAGTNQQRLQLDRDANRRANQMQPLLLQGQSLQNQGQGLLNKDNQLKLQEHQRVFQAQQNADAAFHQTQKAGGTIEDSLNAYQDHLLPEDQLKFSDMRENHQELVRKNNITAINDAAGISAQTMRMIDSIKQSKLSASDQAQQIDQLLQSANRNLDRIDPKHPKIKTEQDLTLYSVATIGTLMNPKVRAGYQWEMNKIKYNNDTKAQATVWQKKNEPTDLDKSQTDVRNKQQNLENAKKSGDPKAISQAQTELDQAQAEVRGQLNGKSISGQIAGSIGNALSGTSPSGLINGAANYINNIGSGPNTPQQPAQPPQAPQASNIAPTQADIEYTAQKYGMTVDQVKAKLGIK